MIDRSIGQDLPVALTYTTTLKQGSINRPGEQIYFKNPYRAPLWVDEMHFVVDSGEAVSAINKPPLGVFAMRLKINNKYIIDEYVPLNLLGPKTDLMEDQGYTGKFIFFWRLAKPLWLDELDDITVELTWISDLNIYFDPTLVPSSVPIEVTLSGRSTLNSRRPKERFLPFNVVWGPDVLSSDLTTPLGVELNIFSPDSALRNGRDVPVCVTRMLGFVAPRFKAGVSGRIPKTSFLMNLRLSHSLGYYLVKDLTPFDELFQNLSRAVDFKFILNPKEFLTLELQTSPITLSGYPAATVAFNYLYGFALQGYSTEALR